MEERENWISLAFTFTFYLKKDMPRIVEIFVKSNISSLIMVSLLKWLENFIWQRHVTLFYTS